MLSAVIFSSEILYCLSNYDTKQQNMIKLHLLFLLLGNMFENAEKMNLDIGKLELHLLKCIEKEKACLNQ